MVLLEEAETHLKPRQQKGEVQPRPHLSGSWWVGLSGWSMAEAAALWGGGHILILL